MSHQQRSTFVTLESVRLVALVNSSFDESLRACAYTDCITILFVVGMKYAVAYRAYAGGAKMQEQGERVRDQSGYCNWAAISGAGTRRSQISRQK